MPDLAEIIPHLSNANSVRGGAMLFSDAHPPVLPPRGMTTRAAPHISPNLKSRRVGNRRQNWADSAEAIRSLKRAHGVPPRPTDQPVDIWAKGVNGHG